MLISTPIIAGEDGGAGNFGASSGGDFEFGIDPSLDPELALVRIGYKGEVIESRKLMLSFWL